MKSFKKFVESCKAINEAEYNKEWWDSKSDSFKKRYIEKHPNSIYAQKSRMAPNQKKEISKFVDKAFGKNSKAAKTTRDNLDNKKTISTKNKAAFSNKDYDWANSESPEKIETVRQKAVNMKPHDKIWCYDDIIQNKWASKDTVQAIANDIISLPDTDPIFSLENERPDTPHNRYSNWEFLSLHYDDLMHDPRISKESKLKIKNKFKRIEQQHEKTVMDFIRKYDDEKAAKHGGKEYNLLPSDLLKKLNTKYDYRILRSELPEILKKIGAKGKIDPKRLENWW